MHGSPAGATGEAEDALAAADRLDPEVGTYLARFDDYALERAAVADRELAAGFDALYDAPQARYVDPALRFRAAARIENWGESAG